MKKSFWFWLCFIAAVVLAVYFSVRIIMTARGRGPTATIGSVYVSSDSGAKNLDAVAAAIGIPGGTKTYSAKLDGVLGRVSAVPGVKTAAVRRLPNGNLSVRVELHRAVALWTDGLGFFPVSADGTIVNAPLEQRPVGAVVFRGPLPGDISQIAKAGHGMAAHLDFFEWIENRRWNMRTLGHITVMLPEENPLAAISALAIMDKKHQILSKNIRVLDMRDKNRILVR
jgi:cell division protein FtsQ